MTKQMLTYWWGKRDFRKAQKLIEKLVRQEISLQHAYSL